MIKKKAVILLSAAALLASCADVPDNVRNKPEGQDSEVAVGSGVTVDRLLEGAEDVSAYIKEKGYGAKFVLESDVHIDLPEQLYELETETVSEAQLKFPEVYSKLFGRDFYEDSGVKDFSELMHYSEHINEHGYFFDDWSTMGSSIIYAGGDCEPPEYTMYLDVSTGGFLFFRDERYDTAGGLAEIINAGSLPLPDREYTFKNGEKCSLKALAENTEKKFNEVLGSFTDQYSYRAGMIYPYTAEDGTCWMYIDMERCYKGVPFCNHIIVDQLYGVPEPKKNYPVEGRMQYAPIYIAEVDEPDHIFDIDCPNGIDKVISETELSGGLVSLPQALDIMNNELSPKIELHISDIRLCYMCDYDSADVEAAFKVRETTNYQDMTKEQQALIGNPTLIPGRRYRAYPVWEFRLDKRLRDKDGFFLQREACDMITVDVRTGELNTYFDCISQR